jgi:CubicO group peptidase (beta-lactamase class C family)
MQSHSGPHADTMLDRVSAVLDDLYRPDAPHGLSLATVLLRNGALVAERYGRQPETIFGPAVDLTADSTLISWSTAKSMTHAAVGILVGEGRLDPAAPAAVPEWQGTANEAITLQHLLEMRPGLLFVEDYVDDAVSHCLEMLYGAGQHDTAAYAAGLPPVAAPGERFNYASGTTNIVSRIVGDAVAGPNLTGLDRRHVYESWLHERLFGPAGMTSAIPKFDDAGNWIGSSYVFATATDFARFGELYRNDGIGVSGERVLPAGWAAHAATWSATDGAFDYGAHWWLWRDYPDVFAAHGYEGQYVIVSPARGVTLVHLGKSPIDLRPLLVDQLRLILDACPLR